MRYLQARQSPLLLLFTPLFLGGANCRNNPDDDTDTIIPEATAPKKYGENDPLGAALEVHFRQLHQSCKLLPSGSTPAGSFVPIAVLTGPLDPAMDVDALDVGSAARLFYQVLEARDFDSTKKPDPALALDFGDKVEPLPQENTGAVLYRQDCTRSVQAAIEAEVNPPYASIKTALSGSGSANAEIAIAAGRFFSPLYLQLTSRDDAVATRARFLLWDHYSKHRDRIPEEAWYLIGFDGVVVYTGTRSQSEAEGSFSAEAGGSFSFAQVEGSLQLQGARSRTLQVDDYAVYIRKTDDAKSAEFSQLPSEDSILDYFENSSFALSSADTFLLANSTKPLTFRIPGTPPSLCNRDRWRLELEAKDQGTISFAKEPDPLKGCEFFLNFVPADALFTGSKKGDTIAVGVKMTNNGAPNSEGRSLTISAKATLNRLDDLGVKSFGDYDKIPQFRDDGGILEWHLGRIELDDAKDRIVPNSARPDQRILRTTCKSILATETDVLFVTGPSGNDARLDIRTRLATPGPGRIYSTTTTRACALVVELTVPLAGVDARREVTISVEEPTEVVTAEANAAETNDGAI